MRGFSSLSRNVDSTSHAEWLCRLNEATFSKHSTVPIRGRAPSTVSISCQSEAGREHLPAFTPCEATSQRGEHPFPKGWSWVSLPLLSGSPSFPKASTGSIRGRRCSHRLSPPCDHSPHAAAQGRQPSLAPLPHPWVWLHPALVLVPGSEEPPIGTQVPSEVAPTWQSVGGVGEVALPSLCLASTLGLAPQTALHQPPGLSPPGAPTLHTLLEQLQPLQCGWERRPVPDCHERPNSEAGEVEGKTREVPGGRWHDAECQDTPITCSLRLQSAQRRAARTAPQGKRFSPGSLSVTPATEQGFTNHHRLYSSCTFSPAGPCRGDSFCWNACQPSLLWTRSELLCILQNPPQMSPPPEGVP